MTSGAARFVGSKGGAGVWQRIISQMPPHELYVEPFVGRGWILLHKRPASSSIAVDVDAAACETLRQLVSSEMPSAAVNVICGEAVRWLEAERMTWTRCNYIVVYCDPPYLFSVRNDKGRQYYAHEFGTEEQHTDLLGCLSRLTTHGVHVLLSGYRSELYDQMLSAWRRLDYPVINRGGSRVTESLWCNFDPPAQLHDYRWLGKTFRERERIKRKKLRWLARLGKMQPLEAAAMLAAIDEWRSAIGGSGDCGSIKKVFR